MAKNTSFWFSSKGLSALGLIAAASYFLLMEHREHVYQLLPFLILLLCPLMHLFMHRGHHHRHHHTDDEQAGKDKTISNKQSNNDDYRRGYQEGLKHSKDKRDQ